MLNTFFFGYLSGKIKVLFRVAVFLDFFIYVYIFNNYFNLLGTNFFFDLTFVLTYCLLVAIISWGLKFLLSKDNF